jgi:hypothetical protein
MITDGFIFVQQEIPWMKTLRKPRLNNTRRQRRGGDFLERRAVLSG